MQGTCRVQTVRLDLPPTDQNALIMMTMKRSMSGNPPNTPWASNGS